MRASDDCDDQMLIIILFLICFLLWFMHRSFLYDLAAFFFFCSLLFGFIWNDYEFNIDQKERKKKRISFKLLHGFL